MRKCFILAVVFISACNPFDPNSEPKYNPNTGRPVNCRAIIEDNIRGYKAGEWSAEGALESIDRNCGAKGYSW